MSEDLPTSESGRTTLSDEETERSPGNVLRASIHEQSSSLTHSLKALAKEASDDPKIKYAALLSACLTSATEEITESTIETDEMYPSDGGPVHPQQQEQRENTRVKEAPLPLSPAKKADPKPVTPESPDSLSFLESPHSSKVQHGARSRASSTSSLAYSFETSPQTLDSVGSLPAKEHRKIQSRNQQQQQEMFVRDSVAESPPSPVSTEVQQHQMLVYDSAAESPPSPVTSIGSELHPATAAVDPPAAHKEILMLPSLEPKGAKATKAPLKTVRIVAEPDNKLHLWQLSELRRQGFPVGLALEVAGTKATYPCRFWVVDNSGSMLTPDGHKVHFRESGNKDRAVVTRCNRWVELQQAVEEHAVLSGLIQASTVFRLLNHPGTRVGPQEFSVADPATFREKQKKAKEANAKKSGRRHALKKVESTAAILKRSIEQDVEEAVRVVQNTRPAGATPLTPHLLEFRKRVLSQKDELLRNDQKAVVVIATDGLPTDNRGDESEDAQEEFVEALQSLKLLPVWIVVRLCTDDRKVVDFWNSLDQMLELPLEVIDDFLGEAKEIFAANPWLNYALPMHRCREMGYHHRIFDLLDERLLTKDEVHEFFGVRK